MRDPLEFPSCWTITGWLYNGASLVMSVVDPVLITERHEHFWCLGWHTVACHYNGIQYNIVLYKVLLWLGLNLIRGWTDKRHPIHHLTGELWGIFCEDLEENWPGYKAPHGAVRCQYNAVNFIQNPHKRHPIAHPRGRYMGCLLWFSKSDSLSRTVIAVYHVISW